MKFCAPFGGMLARRPGVCKEQAGHRHGALTGMTPPSWILHVETVYYLKHTDNLTRYAGRPRVRYQDITRAGQKIL